VASFRRCSTSAVTAAAAVAAVAAAAAAAAAAARVRAPSLDGAGTKRTSSPGFR